MTCLLRFTISVGTNNLDVLSDTLGSLFLELDDSKKYAENHEPLPLIAFWIMISLIIQKEVKGLTICQRQRILSPLLTSLTIHKKSPSTSLCLFKLFWMKRMTQTFLFISQCSPTGWCWGGHLDPGAAPMGGGSVTPADLSPG